MPGRIGVRMRADEVRKRLHRLWETVCRYKYAAVLLLSGVILLLIPASGGEESGIEEAQPESGAYDVCTVTQERLEEILSLVEGAGEVRVLLSAEDSGERVVATDVKESEEIGDAKGGKSSETESSTVVISTGSGTQDAVTLKEVVPRFRGAVVAAQGADSARVRLELTEAVAAATGLPFASIKVVKMG